MTPASTPSTPAATPRRYTLFISYRHADNLEMGRKWATWLHESVENYEIPEDLIGRTDLRGNPVPPSLYPVFRDEEELPADADLSTNLRRALENSGLLVVICSPRAAKSRFVADEIRHFKEIGKSDRILALMIDGEPDASEDPSKRETFGPGAECFPEPLRYGVPGEDGGIAWTTRAAPTAADCRPGGRPEQGWTTAAAYQAWLETQPGIGRAERNAAVRAYAERLELAKLKVIAGALGLPLGELTRRDKVRQLRKARQRSRLLIGLSTVFALLAAAAALLGGIANQRRKEADHQRSQADIQRQAADAARADAEREKRQAVATLAASDFQEGIHRLQHPGTARDGLAYLARATRAGHPAAAARIWTLFQERSFWLPAASENPPAPTQRRMRRTKPPRRFGDYAEPTWYAESADGKRCVTVVSNALAGEGMIAFRFWTTSGEPIGPWRSLDYQGDSHLSGIEAAVLSGDGRFAAIVASPWREPQVVEIWDVDLGRPIDKPFPASGGHPNDQGGAFHDIWFQPAEPGAPGPLLVTLSNRGSAAVHRIDAESSTIWHAASNEHDQPVTLAELRPDLDLFASAAIDGSVHICRLSTGEAVGWPLGDMGAVEALRIDADDRITLLAGGKASSWSLIRPERLPGPSQRKLQGNRQKGLQKTWSTGDENEPAADAPLPVDELGGLRLQIPDRFLLHLQVIDSSQPAAPLWRRRFPSPIAHARFVSDELVLAQTEFFSTELWNLRRDALEAPAIRESSLFTPGSASDTVLLSSLSPDGSRLLTRSFRWIPPNVGIHAFTVWDTATGKPLSDRRLSIDNVALDEGDTPPETHAEFSADGSWLLFGRCGGDAPDTVTSHLQLSPPPAIAPLIPALAEALGGLHLGADNDLRPIFGDSSATLDAVRQALAD